jgi:hypothetical protein
MSTFAHDCLAIDPACLSPQGRAWLADADKAIETGRDPMSGVAWIDDDGAREGLRDLVSQLESHFADLWITWDDGYVIQRVTGGPLSEGVQS